MYRERSPSVDTDSSHPWHSMCSSPAWAQPAFSRMPAPARSAQCKAIGTERFTKTKTIMYKKCLAATSANTVKVMPCGCQGFNAGTCMQSWFSHESIHALTAVREIMASSYFKNGKKTIMPQLDVYSCTGSAVGRNATTITTT